MGIFDFLNGGGAPNNTTKTITLPFLPKNINELLAMPGANLQDEFAVAALCVAVLCNWERDPQSTIEMLNYLRGPQPMSVMDQQFIRDRLAGKQYKTFSFFRGATVQNNYTPTMPLTIDVSTNPYTYQNENRATLHLRSAGADSLRQIALRKKPSTGQWFVTDIFLLSDIRTPAAQDPWA